MNYNNVFNKYLYEFCNNSLLHYVQNYVDTPESYTNKIKYNIN